jgi:pimeloyl-ACP methyl ester carboxylesterase
MATQWLDNGGGRLAYTCDGDGALVVCLPGLGDLRQEYRFLAPALAAAGFAVATMDLRGHGESSTGWRDVSAEAIGGDVLALIHHLGAGHALVIGTSMAAGAAVWAAAEQPDAVSGLVLIGPFVRDVDSPAKLRLYRALFRVLLARPWGPVFWTRYWASLFPSFRPADFDAYAARLRENLAEPGRCAALRAMLLGPSSREIEARLPQVSAPTLVVMGSNDRDFDNPETEARLVSDRVGGEMIVIDGAGHYPHVEFPDAISEPIIRFLCEAERQAARANHRRPARP